MPDTAPTLNELLDQWSREALETQPSLATHLEEIADHLHSDVEARVTSGQPLAAAFAAAVDQFGDLGDLSREFAKSAHLPGRMFGWLADDRHTTRGDLSIGASWIGMSLLWAIAIIASPIAGFELTVNWMLVGWFSTTVGPLTALEFKLRRTRAARAN
jgi:hypothetical protein